MRQGIAVTTRACRPKRENVKPQAGIVLGLRREKSFSENRALSVMPLRGATDWVASRHDAREAQPDSHPGL